ncbi:MAG: cyclase, partial [Actinomycetota bacterium]
MGQAPETRFARNGDVHLAYQVVGDGAIDVLFIDSWFHHVEMGRSCAVAAGHSVRLRARAG